MAKDESAARWPAWPVAGAVGAGRRDETPPVADSFVLTPSGQAEQAVQAEKEMPDAGPE